MKKYFTYSNLIFFVCFVVSLTLAIIFSSLFSWLIFLSTISGILSAKLTAEGKWFTFIFDIISYGFYIYICIATRYYGEMVLSIIIIVIHLASLFEWKNNQIKKVVKVNSLSKKEILVISALFLVSFAIYFTILYFVKTEQPILNALATLVFLVGNYFCFRRSALQFYFFILYEVFFIALWIIAACAGNFGSLIFLIGAIGESIFEIIGIVKWQKVHIEQQNSLKE